MMSEIGSHPELDPALDLQSPILRELLRYWEGAKAGKPLPARADIDPLEIGPALLPYILIAEVEYEPKLRFRWPAVVLVVASANPPLGTRRPEPYHCRFHPNRRR